MNNLVAYDADSDEESPRRRSGSDGAHLVEGLRKEQRENVVMPKRRLSDEYGEDPTPESNSSSPGSNSNFAEPPPPKRVSEREHSASPAAFRTPQIGMPHTSSQASLVSYSGDGDDDEEPEGKPITESAPASELHEPAPPIRRSGDAESDGEQELIDLAIREGQEMNRQKDDLSPADTPGSEATSESPARIVQLDSDIGEELRVPPPPDVEVDPEIVARFERAFEQKAGGTDLNRQIQGNHQYNNPMSYATFISAFEIDEKGTNFASNIFDPHCFPENCFYDAIAEEQKKLTEPPKKK